MDHEQTPQATTSALQAPVAQSQTVEDNAFHPEHSIQMIVTPSPRDSSAVASTMGLLPTSTERPLLGTGPEGQSTFPHSQNNPYADPERVPPPPPPTRSRDGHAHASSNHGGLMSGVGLHLPRQNDSGIDWIVPMNEKDRVSLPFDTSDICLYVVL